MECEVERESNTINKIAIIFAKEGKKKNNYKQLLDYSYRMLYEIPLKYKLIDERDLSDFYCTYHDKIPPYIDIFDWTKGSYYNFLRSVIWNMSHFYKLRNSKVALEEQIKENIYTSSQITNDTFAYERIDEAQFIITRVHHDRVCESSLEYNKFSSYPQLDKQRNEQLRKDFQEIIDAKKTGCKEIQFENSFFRNLYKRMDNKVTRRRILLYIMIFPDLILDYYTDECSKLFSVDEELIIELLSTSRLFFTNVIDKIESEKERSAKLMMRILELKAMKDYTKYYNNIDELDRKIEKTTEYYNTALANVEKLKNRHISQRTLGKALNIKSGTMASSINYSKKILKECCNTQ